jgi:hypothetical protein
MLYPLDFRTFQTVSGDVIAAPGCLCETCRKARDRKAAQQHETLKTVPADASPLAKTEEN